MNWVGVAGLIFTTLAFLFTIGKPQFFLFNIIGTILLDIYAIFFLHDWIIIVSESVILLSLVYQDGRNEGEFKTVDKRSKKLP